MVPCLSSYEEYIFANDKVWIKRPALYWFFFVFLELQG
jgi:hypothetical protein